MLPPTCSRAGNAAFIDDAAENPGDCKFDISIAPMTFWSEPNALPSVSSALLPVIWSSPLTTTRLGNRPASVVSLVFSTLSEPLIRMSSFSWSAVKGSQPVGLKTVPPHSAAGWCTCETIALPQADPPTIVVLVLEVLVVVVAVVAVAVVVVEVVVPEVTVLVVAVVELPVATVTVLEVVLLELVDVVVEVDTYPTISEIAPTDTSSGAVRPSSESTAESVAACQR